MGQLGWLILLAKPARLQDTPHHYWKDFLITPLTYPGLKGSTSLVTCTLLMLAWKRRKWNRTGNYPASWQSAVGFRWRNGDLLAIDIMQWPYHYGRISFTSPRKILSYFTKTWLITFFDNSHLITMNALMQTQYRSLNDLHEYHQNPLLVIHLVDKNTHSFENVTILLPRLCGATTKPLSRCDIQTWSIHVILCSCTNITNITNIIKNRDDQRSDRFW